MLTQGFAGLWWEGAGGYAQFHAGFELLAATATRAVATTGRLACGPSQLPAGGGLPRYVSPHRDHGQ